MSPAVPRAEPEEEQVSSQIEAIRNLARTQGLTQEGMSGAEQDTKILEYAEFPAYDDENLTQIIIKLTGYARA
jgi:hypothetical protein